MKTKPAKYNKARSGMAMLVVLFIVMGITLFSMAYIARCDSELICAKNMGLRIRMEYQKWLQKPWINDLKILLTHIEIHLCQD